MHQSDEADLHLMLLRLDPGVQYPYHVHLTRDEVYIVLQGELTVCAVANDVEKVWVVSSGGVVLVPARVRHSVANRGAVVCTFSECRRGPFDPLDTER